MTDKTQPSQRRVWIKFMLLVLLLAGYFAYLSYKYDFLTGGVAAALTWSFFVLCTPVADAGALLAAPLRLLFSVRMVYSELAVTAMAFGLNFTCFFHAAHYYQTTGLTKLFYQILSKPYPYWAIIIISTIGTFVSLYFGDEMVDALLHRPKGYFRSRHFVMLLATVSAFALIVLVYYQLLRTLNLSF